MTETVPAGTRPITTEPAGPPVRANMRIAGEDGTLLATDVYLPDRTPAPVVVTRTPHGRSVHLAEGLGWRRRGFAFVVQDVRGRYDSDGTWVPYHHERGDGASLASWVGAQPWCDGRLVACGGSYAAYTAWALAVEARNLVRAVISSVPAMGLHRVKFDPSGILRLAEHANWWLERADSRTSRDGLVAAMHREQPGVLDHLPVCELPARLWADLPGWAGTLATGPQPHPEAISDAELAGLDVASLHIGGWYDLLASETLHQWATVAARVTPRPTRTLVFGPWGHDLVWAPSSTVGDRPHGPGSRVDIGALQVRWLSHVLGDHAAGDHVLAGHAGSEPQPSWVYLVGADAWATIDQWPPTGVADLILYPTAEGGLTQAPASPGQVSFRYDPLDPMPSLTPGADRSRLDHRADAARFTTGPLAAPLTLAGAPRLYLAVATTAVATDWVVRLSERTASGALFALTQGTVTSSQDRDGAVLVELGPLAARVVAGSRLELEITSSDFPYLARSLNTGADRYTTRTTAVANQTVRAGGSAGTRLQLPAWPAPPTGGPPA